MKKLNKEVVEHIFYGSCDSKHSIQELLARDTVNYLVIYFYPMDKTPLCTVQGHHYTKLLQKFLDLKALPIGVSEGTAKGKKSFSKSCNYNHLLLADTDYVLSKAFCSYVEQGGDEHINSRIERKTYIINKKYEIIYSDENVKFKTDAEATLSFISKLS